MSMKGMLYAVLCETEQDWLDWQREVEERRGDHSIDLQRCKRICTMLDVYQAQKGHVQIIQRDGWIGAWNGGQIEEIKRRLGL